MRKSELTKATWEEVDFDQGVWTIPEERRFVWLLSLDVEPAEWEARNDAYYADPVRESLDPDPARLIESQRRALVRPVDF